MSLSRPAVSAAAIWSQSTEAPRPEEIVRKAEQIQAVIEAAPDVAPARVAEICLFVLGVAPTYGVQA